MIPVNIDPITTTISENGGKSIFDWFDQHQQSFYTLGWCYLRNQQQMEELFYRSILKIQKEWPRFKSNIPFEIWVTSIFIHICRELSGDGSLQGLEESESHQGLFTALNPLQQDEKEAMVLTYVQGFSKEDEAYLLQVSAEKVNELLSSGIQSLRNGMYSETSFHGCMDYRKDYLNYIERAMERSKKIDFEVHIYHCQQCQEDLATFQDARLTMLNLTERVELHIPDSFMENVKERLQEQEKHRKQKRKKRQRKGLTLASVCVLVMGIGFFTGVIPYLYYLLTEEDPQLRTFLQQGNGQRLNLVAESEGVKVKIKSVIADELQTLVFYEIEDKNADNQYMLNLGDGVDVENDYEIMHYDTFPIYYPPELESDINRKEKNVYLGKMSLQPLKGDSGTIKLKITNLKKLIRDSSKQNTSWDYMNIENKSGEWDFEIPVTKQPSTEYALNKEIEIEGIPVRFDKLIMAPTATLLQVSVNNEQPEKRIESINFNDLEVNNQKVKANIYGSTLIFSEHSMNWDTFQIRFDPLLGEKPKEVSVQFKSVYLSLNENQTIKLDEIQEFPQTFNYAGSTIILDKQEDEQSTNIVISNREMKNRAYEVLHFDIVSEDENQFLSMEMEIEDVLVDKNGMEYDLNQSPYSYNEIEQPRYFHNTYNIRLHDHNLTSKKLVMNGYSKTEYVDDIVKFSLE
ncbi:DUF4179 domain-containing protein [Peribacillus huizhouensis]|uniref:DNA-directed RNA polymerase specialized sigma24 family protein n=1 Tax=Peribacillus huizhouensis TaxID=1501239 RepID=A0ABR6CNZ6_9BACI|nr:DUF4179 domain-containing protein [Peribacillus huizhouensis]MBA9026406.1 DNA-directed RNA polymerase specialized sigma24 family protein [Peribacillus huizhouensis]